MKPPYLATQPEKIERWSNPSSAGCLRASLLRLAPCMEMPEHAITLPHSDSSEKPTAGFFFLFFNEKESNGFIKMD